MATGDLRTGVPMMDVHANFEDVGGKKKSFKLPDVLKPLMDETRWVVWRLETKKNKKGELKKTKVPYRAANPNWKADSTNPKTWGTYDAAAAAALADGIDGIGFCLFNSRIGAFDIDHCIDTNGEIHPFAKALIARAGSYAEITPSGKGLRIIGTTTGPKIHCKKKVPNANGVSVEIYRVAERYITVTGKMLEGAAKELANLDTVMEAVFAELGGMAGDDEASFEADDDYEDIAPDDPRLSKLGSKWKALGYEGEGIAENYGGDRSRAVMAFACECFRAGIEAKVIAACLMRWKIGEHIRDQGDIPRALKRAMVRAFQFVKDSKLFEMNETHCVLPIGGKTRVATWDDDQDFPGRKIIVRFSPFGDFMALYDKYRHTYASKDKDGNPIQIRLGSWWISQAHRRQYDGGMRFMPQCDEDVVKETLNLW